MSVFDDDGDPHGHRPWKFPEEGVSYEGVIVSAPYVQWRLDKNGRAERTREGDNRWALWLTVETEDGLRGFCIDNNQLAKAFDGRATERNLSRWAASWQVGGRLTLRWNSSPRKYRGRYDAPASDETPT
jgi:hypothetical protein